MRPTLTLARIKGLGVIGSDFTFGWEHSKNGDDRDLGLIDFCRLEIARGAWRAYRTSTPQAWFGLLEMDLLRRAVAELLGELPRRTTGLSATEMWMLERISNGDVRPEDFFVDLLQREERGDFDYWEIGELLDGLAHDPAPAVAGLNEGPFTLEMHDDHERHQRYRQSKLSLTALGKAILAKTEDFSRHNPIHRWWGGTELTND